MSDSETADAPSESTISRTLRDVVIAIHKSGKVEDLTTKRVRARVETELGLSGGFLKRSEWNEKSRAIILEAVEKYVNNDAEPEPESEPTPPKSKPLPSKKSKTQKESSRGVKRKAAAPVKKVAKRRKAVSSDEESGSVLSDAESEPPKKPARRKKAVVSDESDEEEETSIPKGDVNMEDEDDEPAGPQKQTTPPAKVVEDGSDSDLSSLIDEPPVKKRQKSSQKVTKEKNPKAPKAKAKPKADDDPNQAEIKRLQGWLVKCGIRKVWGKELARFDTPKEKIRHLKGMLSDAGMDGKYSVEKAARIKEQREFAKDLEEIQAGAAAWGQQEVTQTGRPRRAANRPPPPKVAVPLDSEDEDGANDDKDEDGDEDDEDEDSGEDSEASASGADDDSD
ncbi:hypothetical protein DM02DRAFT_723637 [Periconia macrospinosa]|uniref:DEK C-terminal domain-containing protein n=1 Tax=Periconia macrospinosa TaxID=97972 RepID=A0A2V1EDR3_9PLEO|nr:hypothetical protein DM02DRAFT_723637 [Periconia macrospinosa]